MTLPSNSLLLASCALLGLALHSPAALAQARGSTPAVSSQQIIDALKNPPPPPPPSPASSAPSKDKRSRNFGIEANPDYVNRPAPPPAPAAAPQKPATAAAAPAKPPRPGAPAVSLNEPEEWPPRGTITLNKPDVPAPAAAARPAPSIDLALQFEYNSSKMTRDSQKTLVELAKALASPELAKLHFLVQGHTDGKGLAAYNQKLSQARAEQVKRLLVQNKIAASRLTAEGKGASEPLDANNIEAAENRRVRIISLAR